MNAKQVTVIAEVRARPGQEAEVRRRLLALVGPSRKHGGCINYDLHQSVENPALFMFHENWCSQGELEQHLEQSEVKAVLSGITSLLAEPPRISLWNQIA